MEAPANSSIHQWSGSGSAQVASTAVSECTSAYSGLTQDLWGPTRRCFPHQKNSSVNFTRMINDHAACCSPTGPQSPKSAAVEVQQSESPWSKLADGMGAPVQRGLHLTRSGSTSRRTCEMRNNSLGFAEVCADQLDSCVPIDPQSPGGAAVNVLANSGTLSPQAARKKAGVSSRQACTTRNMSAGVSKSLINLGSPYAPTNCQSPERAAVEEEVQQADLGRTNLRSPTSAMTLKLGGYAPNQRSPSRVFNPGLFNPKASRSVERVPPVEAQADSSGPLDQRAEVASVRKSPRVLTWQERALTLTPRGFTVRRTCHDRNRSPNVSDQIGSKNDDKPAAPASARDILGNRIRLKKEDEMWELRRVGAAGAKDLCRWSNRPPCTASARRPRARSSMPSLNARPWV